MADAEEAQARHAKEQEREGTVITSGNYELHCRKEKGNRRKAKFRQGIEDEKEMAAVSDEVAEGGGWNSQVRNFSLNMRPVETQDSPAMEIDQVAMRNPFSWSWLGPAGSARQDRNSFFLLRPLSDERAVWMVDAGPVMMEDNVPMELCEGGEG